MAESQVLQRIVSRKRDDVAARRDARPAQAFGDLEPSDRSLEAALGAPHTGFILECKKASPSRGLLRDPFDPASLAREYVPVADAISVVVDQPFFQGQLDWLGQVRAAVDVPVLCKDFVVEPYQVREARFHGADAILLMLSVLDDQSYRQCAEVARALSLDVLTEVHDGEELERALALDARIVGINNRDLKTLDVNLETTRRLASRVPSDRRLVSESGIFCHREVMDLRELADGFLVGTSLVTASNAARAARELAFGPVKVCGLTRPQDARAVWESGATWGGLIQAPVSPRCVDLEQAREVRAAAPLQWVGVFVDADPSLVAERARALDLTAVQLHGDEDPAYVADLRPRLPEGCEVWVAARVRDAIPEPSADRQLLDAFEPGRRGGTGQAFDWSLLEDHPGRDRMVLAGGLSPANAAEADRQGVYALDVNSGVEVEPGIKCPAKLRAFFAQLRGQGRSAT